MIPDVPSVELAALTRRLEIDEQLQRACRLNELRSCSAPGVRAMVAQVLADAALRVDRAAGARALARSGMDAGRPAGRMAR